MKRIVKPEILSKSSPDQLQFIDFGNVGNLLAVCGDYAFQYFFLNGKLEARDIDCYNHLEI
jgi:hypothetical protein